jgi:DNA-binding response OmpR family regulator
MRNLTILVADNDAEALSTVEEYLTALGFNVLTAASPGEAKEIFHTHLIHLAVFDMRMVDDNDEKDRSGLKLAREVCPSIPKLILTKFPTHEDVREAMKLDDRSLPAAVDFLNKLDGVQRLAEAINQAVTRYVRINHELVILFNETHGNNFFHLAGLVTSHPSSEQLRRNAEELEDLFRRLFYAEQQVKIDRLLWHRPGRAAVTVFAYMTGNIPESFVVVFGQAGKIAEELHNYQTFAPKAPGHNTSVLSRTVETAHLAGVAYGLAGLDLEALMSLNQIYHMSSDRALANVLSNLFRQTLVEWHENKKLSDDQNASDQWYRTRLHLAPPDSWQEGFRQRALSLAQQIPALGAELQLDADRLTIRFGDQSFSYPDPERVLSGILPVTGSMLLMKTPGDLSADNILTDGVSRTWVTDFATAGLAPHVWNFINLEATVRFDLLETDKLHWIHQMEQALVASEFNRFFVGDFEAPLRKPVKAIKEIRGCASEMIGKQRIPYHQGLLYLATRRLMDFNPAIQLTTHELVRLTHILIATAMICKRIIEDLKGAGLSRPRASQSIRVDKSNHTVWVDGMRVALRGQSYDLLCQLYDQANKLCTRRSLVEGVFAEEYSEFNESQVNRLNTAIRRLREKIEADPANPRFIITEPHGGYRLVI